MESKGKNEKALVDGQPSQDTKVVALPKEKREPTSIEQARIEKLKSKNPYPTSEIEKFVKIVGEKSHLAIKESLEPRIALEDYYARLCEATGFTDESNGLSFIHSIVIALSNQQESLSKEKWIEMFNQFGNLLRELKPQDAVEGLLASQAIVCQEKAFSLIHQSSIQKNVEWARQHSQFANKLLARSQAALDSLIKYRRGGQQKVVVEHVHVEAGGKAAFGTFHTGGVGGTQNLSEGPHDSM